MNLQSIPKYCNDGFNSEMLKYWMCYSIKKSKWGGVEDILFWIFRFVTLNLEILKKVKLYLWKFWKILWNLLEIPRSKNKTHGNSTWFIFEFHFFFLWPLEFPNGLFLIPPEIPHVSSIPVEVSCPLILLIGFFLE